MQDKFRLNKREDYRNCDLSKNTMRILCDIGLPYEPLNFVQFNIREIENIRLNKDYIVIGNDFGTSICINNKDKYDISSNFKLADTNIGTTNGINTIPLYMAFLIK